MPSAFPARRLGVFVAVCLLAAATPAFAWNPPGHMTTASAAYDQLSPAQRERMLAILESHPDFTKWKEAAPRDKPGFDLGRHMFMHASTWPDDIRKSGSPYDHPVWHYVDFPLVPPGFPMEEAPAGEDILTASAACEKSLADPATAPLDRAVALSWLIHLVGDVMQPLHAATMISATNPRPAGDKGGNLFFINLAGNAINLHAYWDNLGGATYDGDALTARGAELEKKYLRSALPELATATDMRGWALESRQLAIDAAYRHGSLPGSGQPEAVLPALPADYASAARAVAERRLALAGYRLADELTRLKP